MGSSASQWEEPLQTLRPLKLPATRSPASRPAALSRLSLTPYQASSGLELPTFLFMGKALRVPRKPTAHRVLNTPGKSRRQTHFHRKVCSAQDSWKVPWTLGHWVPLHGSLFSAPVSHPNHDGKRWACLLQLDLGPRVTVGVLRSPIMGCQEP